MLYVTMMTIAAHAEKYLESPRKPSPTLISGPTHRLKGTLKEVANGSSVDLVEFFLSETKDP